MAATLVQGQVVEATVGEATAAVNAERAEGLLAAAERVTLHSGNIASWSRLRKKGVLNSTDEVRKGKMEGGREDAISRHGNSNGRISLFADHSVL